MVIEGQIHGGLTEAFGDRDGPGDPLRRDRQRPGRLVDGLLPADRGRDPGLGDRLHGHALPHHPIGAKGVGESPNVGGVPAFTNAVVDAFAHLGVTHMPMPHGAWRVWKAVPRAGDSTARAGRQARARADLAARHEPGVRLRRRAGARRGAAAPGLLGRPLLLEGDAGVGKTEVAKALAAVRGRG